jgi:hypothetical protein
MPVARIADKNFLSPVRSEFVAAGMSIESLRDV